MHPEPAPTFSDLPQIAHQGAPVLTTELLARAYGVEPKIIHDGFARNEERFVDGVHFVRLTGDALKAFKSYPAYNGLADKFAPHLFLWTERGAVRHAKLISTDQAWAAFGRLEDTYFDRDSADTKVSQSPEQVGWSASVFENLLKVATLIGLDRPVAVLSANRATTRMTGLDLLVELGTPALVSQRQERVVTASDIGVEIGGLSAIAVNKLLIRHGFQTETRDAKDRPVKVPTGKGDPYKHWVDTGKRHGDGSPVHQLKWTIGIVAALRAEMGDTSVEIAA